MEPVASRPPASPDRAAASAAAASFARLVDKLDYLSPGEVEDVRRAYKCADEAHLGQIRKSGDPYITHPIAVASLCAEWKLDAHALMAALMHDVIEDSSISKQDMTERFGPTVAELVDGLTKLEKLEFHSREHNQAESFRKMLLAMAKDVRVILIKLADRSHNMRTMGDMPRSKWGRISRETLEVYAPIAYRLGLNQTYLELQDLAFRYAKPWRYQTLQKAINKARRRRVDLIDKVQGEITAALQAHGLQARIEGREKALYSVYRKMVDKHLTFSQITDLYGFRVVLPEWMDCYKALGILHHLYKPLPGRCKDYIAIPKSNGYQSLHTVLVGPVGINIEVQIRTEPMDLVAESGIAAHWLYKAREGDAPPEQLGAKWMQSLLDIQSETRDAAEFWENVRVDLFPDAVFVFTPKGKIMSLPRGATLVDFAYAIHSDIGNKAVAATVNGEAAALRTEINNGDVIHIVTSSISEPNPAWLSFVRTGRARSAIRNHLKQMAQADTRVLGEKMLRQALRAEGYPQLPPDDDNYLSFWEKLLRFSGNRNLEELLVDIGLGKRIAGMVAKKIAALLDEELGRKPDMLLISQQRFMNHDGDAITQGALALDGSEGASVQYSACCSPIPGDKIVGYLGRGESLTIHSEDCPTVRKLLERDHERFLAVEWADDLQRMFDARVTVVSQNLQGALARIATTVANAEGDIVHLDMGNDRDQVTLRITVRVRDRVHLAHLLRALRRTPSVLKTQRQKSRA
jgi:GTP pyrophosphokinase